ncbi:MAG: C4-dicarboxylate transporter DctA, partial [Brevibacterium sp.]|nr:C4-dicarboxylate transporter DctA [Brevibacterium sp.]
GLATLAAGLQSHRPELLDGMGVIVGIDKFMSECRALTNFTGNAVATLLIGKWTKEIDMDQARAALNGSSPFDEQSLEPDVHSAPAPGAWDESGEPEEKERVTANA